MNSKAIAIHLKDISFSYNGAPALDGITLDIYERDFIGLIGPNGGGKTTLLKIILGLLKPDKGVIEVFGKPPNLSKPLIGYVPQHLNFDLNFPANVLDVVLMGRLDKKSFFGSWRKDDRNEAMKALEDVAIPDLRNRMIGELSGGQRQRAFIARALCGSPGLLLLDEPTANVDSGVEQDIYELLKKINSTTTIVLVTHDLGFISAYVNRIACINRQLSCHDTSEITGKVVDDVYKTHVEMIRHQCGL